MLSRASGGLAHSRSAGRCKQRPCGCSPAHNPAPQPCVTPCTPGRQVGCLFMALTGVQHAGYVDVNWKKIEDDVMTPLDMDGARASPRSRLAPPASAASALAARRRRQLMHWPALLLLRPPRHSPSPLPHARAGWQGRRQRRQADGQEVCPLHGRQELGGDGEHLHCGPAPGAEERLAARAPRPDARARGVRELGRRARLCERLSRARELVECGETRPQPSRASRQVAPVDACVGCVR